MGDCGKITWPVLQCDGDVVGVVVAGLAECVELRAGGGWWKREGRVGGEVWKWCGKEYN